MQEENKQAENEGSFTTEDWVKAEIDVYDNTERFSTEVLPIIQALEAKCVELGCPFYVRVVVAQNEEGNSSNVASYLGGASRATPELLAINSMQQFGPAYVESLRDFVNICAEKFIGEGVAPLNLNVPDQLEAQLQALLRGGKENE